MITNEDLVKKYKNIKKLLQKLKVESDEYKIVNDLRISVKMLINSEYNGAIYTKSTPIDFKNYYPNIIKMFNKVNN